MMIPQNKDRSWLVSKLHTQPTLLSPPTSIRYPHSTRSPLHYDKPHYLLTTYSPSTHLEDTIWTLYSSSTWTIPSLNPFWFQHLPIPSEKVLSRRAQLLPLDRRDYSLHPSWPTREPNSKRRERSWTLRLQQSVLPIKLDRLIRNCSIPLIPKSKDQSPVIYYTII